MEVRIYYESLEQGHNYIAPMVEELKDDIEFSIRLVKRPGQFGVPNLSGVMKAIHTMVNPDILITVVVEEQEFPLVIIEFTEAVGTEDHELQRSYGAIAALLGGLFYLKVSGRKESAGEFGAGEYDPYTTPRMLKEEYDYEGFIIAEWETEEGNPMRLQHSPGLHSCPPRIQILFETIQCAIRAFAARRQEWFSRAVADLRKTASFQRFAARREIAPTLPELIERWQQRLTQRYFVDELRAGARIYRFGHAMDPDRGIIILISCLLSKTHKIYGQYSLQRQRHATLNAPYTDLDGLRSHLDAALAYDKVPKWFRKILTSAAKRITSFDQTVDINPMLRAASHRKWSSVVRTLFYFCDGIYLGRNGPLLTWNRDDLLGGRVKDDFLGIQRKFFEFDRQTAVTPVRIVSDIVDEDEVTHALVHQVLIPNGFRVLSVSYPGAQGGTAVLPDVGRGKNQKRIYIDVIALPPHGASYGALLNESKGMYGTGAGVEEDVEKLRNFKTSAQHRHALKRAFVRARALAADEELKESLTGVAFGVTGSLETGRRVGEVDFIFRVKNRQEWDIEIFRRELSEHIRTIQGATKFPPCFAVAGAQEVEGRNLQLNFLQ
jgi:hypothetical protein